MQFFNKISWKLFGFGITTSIITILITIWFANDQYKKFYVQNTIEDVSVRAELIEEKILPFFDSTSNYHDLDTYLKQIGNKIKTRITVVLPSGKVIGDSEKDPDSMENHANRPEILQAFHGLKGLQQRYSSTLHQDMLYVAVPIKQNDSLLSILRLAVPLTIIQKHEQAFYSSLWIIALLQILFISLISWLIAVRINKPIAQMKKGALQLAAGDLSYHLPIPSNPELGELARTLNGMSSSLSERIETITRQKNELDAILHCMVEGVIAVDSKECILSINAAAANFLNIPLLEAKGKWLHEIVRNSDLQKFVRSLMKVQDLQEISLLLPSESGEKYVQVHGTPLKDKGNHTVGVLIVFNDLTRLRQLENMRKEFVANVSHELRTPLTSIKGFVETIQNGNYNLSDEVKHFLEIIATKTDRLCFIINDILMLTSVEQDHEHKEIQFTLESVKNVMENAADSCKIKALNKNVALELSIYEDMQIQMNPELIEQAIINLIDNAIKYSSSGNKVLITAYKNLNKENSKTEAIIEIRDYGIGIPQEHLERIFERFYRVDKARSRKMGGTGLGLSIVKNIALAHNGSVSVESEISKGSIFRIHLPFHTDSI